MTPNQNKLERYQALVQQFQQLQRVMPEPTLLELAGYPHYENVISNLLAFFLQPTAHHQLKDLVLSSMLSCLDLKAGLSSVNVEREVYLDGGRLDILVTSDTHIIAIENKIFHHAERNPFIEYARFVNSKFQDKFHYLVVLTPFPERLSESRKEIEKAGFIILTYRQLFDSVRQSMGSFASTASIKHWVLLLDLMQSVENLSKGTAMDPSTVKFFQEHLDTLEVLQKDISLLRAEMRAKVGALMEKFSELKLLTPAGNRTAGGLYRETGQLYDTLYYDLNFPEGVKVGCDITVRLTGWEMKFFPRNARHHAFVTTLLKNRDLPFEEVEGRYRLNDMPRLDFTADISDVAVAAARLLNCLSSAATNP